MSSGHKSGGKIGSVRGMYDLMPPESSKWQHFEQISRGVLRRFCYREIRTPVLELTALFSRGIGEATDVVEKEMYTFPDRKGRSLTMRPEMTASCVRAYIEHGICKSEPIARWFYIGPAFRYEKVQAGRCRQFHQLGVECYGVSSPTLDAEQIAMLHHLYGELGVEDLTVLMNCVGSQEDRPAYRAALVDYLTPHTDALCGDCKRRLQTNPLRALDCKVPQCKAIVADAPSILDYLGDASRQSFEATQAALTALGVPFTVAPRLVRGLDYYTGTVFELLSQEAALGNQSTVVAGGRYDNLVASLGGPDTPAVGFAIGIERTIACMPGEPSEYAPRPDLFLVTRGEAAHRRALALAHSLRGAGVAAEIDHRGVGLKAQLKRANRIGARFAAILGDEELATDRITLRDMNASQEESIATDELLPRLRRELDSSSA